MKLGKKSLILYCLIAIGIWAVAGFLPIYFFHFDKSNVEGSWSVLGNFGQMFGAAGSLIAALGFAGLLYQMQQQHEQLNQQKQDSDNSIAKLSEQTALFAQQLATIKETLEFEKLKLKLASEPVFAWSFYNSNAASVSYHFQNIGSRIRVLSCESNPPATRIEKPNYVDEKQESSFTFVFLNKNGVGAGVPPFEFTINYETQLKEKAAKRFSSKQGSPIELN